MKSLLVSSVQAHSGKSALCLGLGLCFREKGMKVGYFKPLGIQTIGVGERIVDEDADQAKSAFGLKETLDEISPVMISPEVYLGALSGKDGLEKRIVSSYARVSAEKDVVLIDGIGDFRAGRLLNLSDADTAVLLGAKILLISLYDSVYMLDELLSTVDAIRRHEKNGGRILAGVVFNQVPSGEMDELRAKVIPFLKSQGVEVFGVLPKDKLLKSVQVKDIVEELHGETLTGKENTGVFIESFLVGAMSPMHAMKYFRRRMNTAVVTGGDRSDIQLAAIESNVSCIVLTGNLAPTAPILARADELKIPIILVKDDTLSTVERMDALLKRLQVKGDVKIRRITDLIKGGVDLSGIDKLL